MTQPEDRFRNLGREVAQRYVEAFPSKGAARRALGVNDELPAFESLPEWAKRLVRGLPGGAPALPNAAGPRVGYWRNLWNALMGRGR